MFTLSLRIYKDRNLIGNQLSKNEIADKFSDPMMWVSITGKLFKMEAYSKNYPEHEVYELSNKIINCNTVPCKGLIILEKKTDKSCEYDRYKLQYDTVLVHKPQTLKKGLVLTELKVNKPDISMLNKKVWKKLGSAQHKYMYLVELILNKDAEPYVCKDDVTGEYYPYYINRVLYLSRKQ